MDGPTGEPEAALRADARRNRTRVLDAAHVAFAAAGPAVPLVDVAKLAGVGIGTVYRHFSTKEALVTAVVLDRIEHLTIEARGLADAADPGPTFLSFFDRVIDQALLNKALCDALEADMDLHTPATEALHHDFRAAFDQLLARAQESGAVRPDFDIDDVTALLAGCVAMEQRRGVPGRMTALVRDVLRGATKRHVSSEFHNGGQSPRNEIPMAICEMCGTSFEPARTGRPARFCGPACRQKAHRHRTRDLTNSPYLTDKPTLMWAKSTQY